MWWLKVSISGNLLEKTSLLFGACLHHTNSGERIITTVDGRNPAPVDMVNIPLFAGLHTC